jgi:hypothetical protein
MLLPSVLISNEEERRAKKLKACQVHYVVIVTFKDLRKNSRKEQGKRKRIQVL